MQKQPEVTERTKAILIDTFWQLYSQKGIHKISVKEVTDKAGYNRSTFYKYFTDLYDVLNQIEDSLIKYITESVRKSLLSDVGNDTIKQLAELYDSKGEYLSVLLGKHGDPMFTKKIKSSIFPLIMSQFGIKSIDSSTKLMFEFAISGILSAITLWHNEGKPIPSEQMVVMVRSMLMNGVASEILQNLKD